MASQPIDYAALAQQSGATGFTPAQPPQQQPAAGPVDYAALARQAGATHSAPAQQQPLPNRRATPEDYRQASEQRPRDASFSDFLANTVTKFQRNLAVQNVLGKVAEIDDALKQGDYDTAWQGAKDLVPNILAHPINEAIEIGNKIDAGDHSGALSQILTDALLLHGTVETGRALGKATGVADAINDRMAPYAARYQENLPALKTAAKNAAVTTVKGAGRAAVSTLIPGIGKPLELAHVVNTARELVASGQFKDLYTATKDLLTKPTYAELISNTASRTPIWAQQFPDVASEVADENGAEPEAGPATPAPAPQLPSGRTPGGIANQVPAQAPAPAAPPRLPLWAGMPAEEPAASAPFTPASNVSLPSGRTVGGIQNQAAAPETAAAPPPAEAPPTPEAPPAEPPAEAEAPKRKNTETEDFIRDAVDNKVSVLSSWAQKAGIDLAPFQQAAGRIRQFMVDNNVPLNARGSQIRKAAVAAGRTDIVGDIDAEQKFADNAFAHGVASGMPVPKKAYNGISQGTWNEVASRVPGPEAAPAGLTPEGAGVQASSDATGTGSRGPGGSGATDLGSGEGEPSGTRLVHQPDKPGGQSGSEGQPGRGLSGAQKEAAQEVAKAKLGQRIVDALKDETGSFDPDELRKTAIKVAQGLKTAKEAATEIVAKAGAGSVSSISKKIQDILNDYTQHLVPEGVKKNPALEFPEDKTLDRLRQTMNRKPGVGGNENKLRVLPDVGRGELAVGQIKPDVWQRRVQQQLKPAEIGAARQWYKELLGRFTDVYGEEQGPRFLDSFLFGNMNASPTKAFQDTLRAADIVAGRPKSGYKMAGLAEDNLIKTLKGETVTSGVGPKLSDFSDSGHDLDTRTSFGNDVRAGQPPGAGDVWAQRDVGKVDQTLHDFIRKNYGDKVADSIKVDGNSIKDPDYEYIAQFYNKLANRLNETKFDGGKWDPKQAQAVGWVAMHRAMGAKAEFIEDAMRSNTRTLGIGLGVGHNTPLEAKGVTTISRPVYDRTVDAITQQLGPGVRVVSTHEGPGLYMHERETSVLPNVLASPEGLRDFMDMVGYGLQQTEVIGSKASELKDPFSKKNVEEKGVVHAIDVVHTDGRSDIATNAGADVFDRAMQKALAPMGQEDMGIGFQPFQDARGRVGARFLNFGGQWTPEQLAIFEKAVRAVEQSQRYKLDVNSGPVELIRTGNDWQKSPNGEDYINELIKRGRVREAKWLDDHLRPAVEGWLTDSSSKSSQGAGGTARNAGAPSGAPESGAGITRASASPASSQERPAGSSEQAAGPASAASDTGPGAGGRGVRDAKVPTSDPEVQAVAARYNQKQGLKPPSHAAYAQIDVEAAKRMADAYDALRHNPSDPKVARAYQSLIEQTKAQWDHAHAAGYKFEPWTREGQPYANSKEMMDDVKNNKHLYYFTGSDMALDHPMAQVDPKTGETYNNLFRAVHDFFGHAKGGYEFGPRGEENAYRAHREMFTDDAHPALTTETKGQNSWVNFGKHLRDENGNVPQRGEPGYVRPAERPYAEQKAGLLNDPQFKPLSGAQKEAQIELAKAKAKKASKKSSR